MARRILPPERMEDIYRCARLAQFYPKPFTGDRLGMFAWYYHQMPAVPGAGIYLFSAEKKLLSLRSIPRLEREFLDTLPSLLREKGASFLGLSLCARRFQAPDPGDEIQLYRYYLYCQNRNLPVLDMILVHRGGYIPLSEMKRENAYLRNPPKEWFL